jgi:hypothetical protein
MPKALTDEHLQRLSKIGFDREKALAKAQPFDFDKVFGAADVEYAMIVNKYREKADRTVYSQERCAEAKENALAKINELKATYLAEALDEIDKTYRPKPQKTEATNEAILTELQRSKRFALLEKQIALEAPSELVAVYHEVKDDPDAADLIELELRSRIDSDSAAFGAWHEVAADYWADEVAAQHYTDQFGKLLSATSTRWPHGLKGGWDNLQLPPIDLDGPGGFAEGYITD